MKFRKIAFALFLSILSFIGYSQINVYTNFNINAPLPIDTRMVVADTTARNNIVWKYEGLSVYVISDQTNYQLRSGNWVSISTSAYTAGTGLTLTGNTFSHDPHTGDVIGATSLTIVAIQGRTLATTTPTSGDVLGWNGSAWAPVDALSNYTTGTGITLSGNTFTADNNSPIWNASQIMGTSISTIAPTNNQVLKWNGTEWIPAADSNTFYAAGSGITLASNTFSADNASPIWNAGQIMGFTVATTSPFVDQILKWNGTEWVPSNDNNTTYAAGTGITLSGNTFSAENTDPIWNANQIMGTSISTTGPIGNQVLQWNGSEWAPANEVAYDAGTGISLSGNTFSANNTAAIWNANQIMGSSIATTTPSANQVLTWNGSEWIPANEVAYDAGTGITLSGNTFSANNTAAIWNANQIMGSSIATNTPSTNQVLTWNGSEWVPAAPALNIYAAGTGLSLSGNTFSALNNSAMWNADQLQGSNISAAIPSNNQVLKWTGASWTPSNEIAYDAGTGISLTGNSFSHIAHTGDAIGATSLTVTGLQGRPIATTIPTAGNVLKWNGALWAMGSPLDTFNGNKLVSRTGWAGVSNVNMGTSTTVSDFLNAVFFPFIEATISINANVLFEVGTSNVVTITGTRTSNNETLFSNGRVDRNYPSALLIFSFGAASSYTTNITFTPNQAVTSSMELRYFASQGVGGNGIPTVINSPTKLVQSCYPYFHGVTTVNLSGGGTAAYTGLTKLVEAFAATKTRNYNGTGYMYFCYPQSYGPLTSILDPSLFQLLPSYNVFSVNITSVGRVNNWTQLYYIYQSNTISTPNGNFQFLY